LFRRSEAEASGNAPIELPRSTSVRLSSEPPRTRSVRQSGFCSKKVRISTKRYRFEGRERYQILIGFTRSNLALSALKSNYIINYIHKIMARRKLEDKNIRKLTKLGKQSIAVTIPIEFALIYSHL